MTDYSRYHPMPYAEALRCAHLEAQQYALERICGLMRDDIMCGALTEGEQATMHGILNAANTRVVAAVAEFDGYLRSEPVAIEMETWGV